MAEVHPFNGIRYNQAKIKDAGAVMCPPHDIIPPQVQDDLYKRSEYNFVRIEFGRELPQDVPTDNRYTRAKATMDKWLAEGILKAEDKPAIYLHEYTFSWLGKTYKRRGIIARVRLEEWSKRIIFPHEGTLSRSKNDRLNILWSCQANTSPVLAMYQDSAKKVSALLENEAKKKPAIKTGMQDGESHVIWVIDEPAVTQQICAVLAPQPLYIADGHHRYESALMYKHERDNYASPTGEESYNFIMMTLVEFNEPGLLILPPHRLVRGVKKPALSGLKEGLKTFFEIEEIPIKSPDLWPRVDRILMGSLIDVRLGLFGIDMEKLYLLRLKTTVDINELIPAFHTDIYKKLDVCMVDHIILEKLIGTAIEGEQAAILDYKYDKQTSINCVLDGEYQLAILLNPVKAETIKAIADAGDRMPRKSTYFYPKEPAGLVFNKMD
ncbi:MAG: DUF1015 domain-containing protein [Dehalococcoidales bacterium]|nr:DUF1015 domain-containing protein [Dehalococcoidales bacterium]